MLNLCWGWLADRLGLPRGVPRLARDLDRRARCALFGIDSFAGLVGVFVAIGAGSGGFTDGPAEPGARVRRARGPAAAHRRREHADRGDGRGRAARGRAARDACTRSRRCSSARSRFKVADALLVPFCAARAAHGCDLRARLVGVPTRLGIRLAAALTSVWLALPAARRIRSRRRRPRPAASTPDAPAAARRADRRARDRDPLRGSQGSGAPDRGSAPRTTRSRIEIETKLPDTSRASCASASRAPMSCSTERPTLDALVGPATSSGAPARRASPTGGSR